MAHTIRDKDKLLNRVRRIRGQVEGLERALEGEQECGNIMRQIAAARGAMDSLMAEVLEGHIHFHVNDPSRRPAAAQAQATRELIEVIRAYLK